MKNLNKTMMKTQTTIIMLFMLFGVFTLNAQVTSEIGVGSTYTGRGIPVEPYYGYSYSQCIYTAKELQIAGLIPGSEITKIA